ncbi:hypothetical protein DSM21852_02870 [Methylocystis bryophila]|uniref:Transposase IS204/IS1001/IS1096/IS1165 DDE domain-containing protein n=1 Tax=Methylocystis bryophila TaxID=655015 RepID=A0A1W6MUC0_9HYPH|nr:hypothetical protein B1812_08475 [Methylocystis bryophila]BDV37034.1 hypothetical protein DSM21852_02870 [Methylocystis bryophila]
MQQSDLIQVPIPQGPLWVQNAGESPKDNLFHELERVAVGQILLGALSGGPSLRTLCAGYRQGAPEARQIADRFHLLQDLRERTKHQLSRSDKGLACPSLP